MCAHKDLKDVCMLRMESETSNRAQGVSLLRSSIPSPECHCHLSVRWFLFFRDEIFDIVKVSPWGAMEESEVTWGRDHRCGLFFLTD